MNIREIACYSVSKVMYVSTLLTDLVIFLDEHGIVIVLCALSIARHVDLCVHTVVFEV